MFFSWSYEKKLASMLPMHHALIAEQLFVSCREALHQFAARFDALPVKFAVGRAVNGDENQVLFVLDERLPNKAVFPSRLAFE